MNGLNGTYQLAITQMVVSGASFWSIIMHSKMIESIIKDTLEGTKKMSRYGEFSVHASTGRYFVGRCSCGYHDRPFQATLHRLGGRSLVYVTLDSQISG